MNEERQAHIDRIARELGCQVQQHPGNHGMMYVEFSRVTGPIIENQRHYLSLLHELGHFALGHTQGRPPHQEERFYFDNGVLRSEAQAWEWGLNECTEPIEELSRRFMWDFCLGGYYQHAIWCEGKPTRLNNGDRAYVEFIYDEPDAFFFSMVKEIQADLTDWAIPFPLLQRPTEAEINYLQTRATFYGW